MMYMGARHHSPQKTTTASDMVRMGLHYINTHLGCYQGCVSGSLSSRERQGNREQYFTPRCGMKSPNRLNIWPPTGDRSGRSGGPSWARRERQLLSGAPRTMSGKTGSNCPGEWRRLGKARVPAGGPLPGLRGCHPGMWTTVDAGGSQPLAGITLPLDVAVALPPTVDVSPTLAQSHLQHHL